MKKNTSFLLFLLIISLPVFSQVGDSCPVEEHAFKRDNEDILSSAQQQNCIPLYLEQKKIMQTLAFSDYEGDLDDLTMPFPVKVPLSEYIEKANYSPDMLWDEVQIKRNDPSFFMHSYYTSFYFSHAPESQFDFDRWLNSQLGVPEGILYQEQEGVIFYDKWGKLRGVRYFYDSQLKMHVFAQALAWTGYEGMERLKDITRNYAILKTLDNPDSLGQLYSTRLLKLAPKQYMKQFNYPFDVKQAKLNINDTLNELLTPEYVLRYTTNGTELRKDNSYNNKTTYLYISTSNKTIPQLKQSLIEEAKGKTDRVEQFTYRPVYEDNQAIIFQNNDISKDRYTYFLIEHKGLTYQFYYHPVYDGDQLKNHLDIIQFLRTFKPLKPNPYTAKMLKHKDESYDFVTKLNIKGKTYLKLVKRSQAVNSQALIDLQGNVIFPLTVDSDIKQVGNFFEVSVKTEDQYVRSLYDTNGRVILGNYTDYASEYEKQSNRVRFCTDEWTMKQCRLFNLKTKQWQDLKQKDH